MTSETMNIHKALSEQKLMDDRIDKEISNTKFVSYQTVGHANVDGIPIDTFKKNAKAQNDKIRDMIRRRDALHRGVQQSNAITEVTIAGATYTVAEAIWMQKYGMAMLQRLRDTMSRQYQKALSTVTDFNEKLEIEADKFITDVYGSNKDVKQDSSTLIEARNTYIESRKKEIVDPVDAVKSIAELSEQIENFLSEVNTVLSTSNAMTQITIEY